MVRETALGAGLRAVLSTQASGGGAHLSHVGTFRVYCRVQAPTANTGTVSVALEWGVGDFRAFVRNAAQAVDADWEASWRLLDLGLVTIPQGATRWEGRILAASTAAGDDVDVDCLFLLPAFGGVAEALVLIPAPSIFLARDEFDQTAGALTGKVLPLGGTWTFGSGHATDFQVSGSGTVTRTETTTTARFIAAGTTDYATIVTQVDISPALSAGGVYARYLDASNFVRTLVHLSAAGTIDVYLDRSVAGVQTRQETTIGSAGWVTLRLAVIGTRVYVWVFPRGGQPGEPVLVADGGVQTTGKIGLVAWGVAVGSPANFTLDNFAAWAPPAADAAIFAGRSLRWTSEGVERQDSTGAIWQPVSYEGDYLRVPVAGREDRKTRFTVIPSKNDPATMAHDFGAISARLTYVPRWLAVPKPS